MKLEYELENQGLIDGDILNENDYLLGNDNPIEIVVNTNTNNYFYNQGKLDRTKNACVLFANAASLGYIMNYEFTIEELLEIVDSAEKDYGRLEHRGMHISKGVDCVRHYWNTKYPDRKVKTFRMTIGDKDFAEALRMNHRIVVGYRTSREYYKDAQSDGKVDGDKFSDFTGGHAVSSMFGIVEVVSDKNGILIQDNYTGSKPFNIYYNNPIKALKDSGTYFPSAYIYLEEETIKDKIRNNIEFENARKFFDRGYTNGLTPKAPISRQELWATMELVIQDLENKIK